MAKSWKKLLSNKNFIYIWSSQIFSQITINILNFALLFTLFEKTASTIAISFLWIAFALPAILIGPFASASVDMIDRRKILVVTNFLQALLIFVYALDPNLSHFYIYTFAIAYSTINQFYVPAEFATLPHVVTSQTLPEANGLFFITQQGSLVIGFGFAGLLLKALGFESTLFLCTFFIFIAFVSTTFLPQMKTEKNIPTKIDDAVITFFRSVYSGYTFIAKNKFVLSPFLIMLGMQVMLSVVIVNTPALVSQVIKIPINLAGIYLIAPAGIGAMIASFLVPRMLRMRIRKIKIIKYSLLVLSLSLAMIVLVFSYMPYIYRVIFSLLALITTGFSFIGVVIPAQTFLQNKTPFEFRGRVFGNFWFLVTVASVFPVIVSGTITEIFGTRTLMMMLVIGILFIFFLLRDNEKKHLVTS